MVFSIISTGYRGQSVPSVGFGSGVFRGVGDRIVAVRSREGPYGSGHIKNNGGGCAPGEVSVRVSNKCKRPRVLVAITRYPSPTAAMATDSNRKSPVNDATTPTPPTRARCCGT